MNGREKYKLFREVCEKENLITLRDLIEYYNNMDTLPFVKAVQNMQCEYARMGIDCFKDSIGSPGVSRLLLMRSASRSNTIFPLINKENSDMYFMFKKMSIGGPSIVFVREAEVNKTHLRPDKECITKKICGYDNNSMYLSILRGKIPSTMFVRRKEEDGFKPRYKRNYLKMFIWLEMMQEHLGEKVKSRATNGQECRALGYLLDGLIVKGTTMIALEFLGNTS